MLSDAEIRRAINGELPPVRGVRPDRLADYYREQGREEERARRRTRTAQVERAFSILFTLMVVTTILATGAFLLGAAIGVWRWALGL